MNGVQVDKNHYFSYIGLIPVFLFVALSVFYQSFSPSVAVVESGYLLTVANSIFVAMIPIVIALYAAKSYLLTGLPKVLVIGCALLVFGAGNLTAGWVVKLSGNESTDTIYNIVSAVASIFYITAAFAAADETTEPIARRRAIKAFSAYFGILLFVTFLGLVTGWNLTPAFFVAGTGPTLLRAVVMTVTVILHVLAAFLFFRLHKQKGKVFLCWFGLALLLTGTGLGVLMQTAADSMIGWVGRVAQYLGGVYFLIAVMAIVREVRVSGVAVEQTLASFFSESELHYKNLVHVATDAIISTDSRGRIILWNAGAQAIFGYREEEAVGRFMSEVLGVSDPDIVSSDRGGQEGNRARTKEVTLTKKDRTRIFSELSRAVADALEGKITTYIIRDITERKRAEEALRESEERSRLAQEAGRIGIFDVNFETGSLRLSPELQRSLGRMMDLKAITWDEWIEHVYSEDRQRLASRIEKWKSSQRPEEQWECRYPTPTGEIRWRFAKARIIRDRNGTALRMVGTSQDISERKRAEKLLEAQKDVALAFSMAATPYEALRSCLEIVIEVSEMDSGGFYVRDENLGSFTLMFHKGFSSAFVNSCSHYGTDTLNAHLAMIGKPIYARYDTLSLSKNSIEEQEGLGAVAIVPLKNEDRVVGYLNIASHRLEEVPYYVRGGIETIAAQIGNGIARLRAEEVLRESEERYRMLFEESEDAIIVTTWEGKITEINNACLDLLGYTRQELGGLLTMNIYADSRQERVVVEDMYNKGSMRDREVKLRRKDGTVLDCRLTGNIVWNKRGRTIGYQGIFRDVTKQKKLERQVLRAAHVERLKIGQDLHDNLGQQITGIALKGKSIAQALTRRSVPEAQDVERLTDLANQAIGQVRDLAKGLVLVDVSGGIYSSLMELAEKTRDIYGISCLADVREDIVAEELTTLHLYYIAQEGIANAIKHGKATRISISLTQENRTTTLTVKDNGIGYSTAGSKEGGLGLHLMKYRAEVIGGSLNIWQAPKKGTVVQCVVGDDNYGGPPN